MCLDFILPENVLTSVCSSAFLSFISFPYYVNDFIINLYYVDFVYIRFCNKKLCMHAEIIWTYLLPSAVGATLLNRDSVLFSLIPQLLVT